MNNSNKAIIAILTIGGVMFGIGVIVGMALQIIITGGN